MHENIAIIQPKGINASWEDAREPTRGTGCAGGALKSRLKR